MVFTAYLDESYDRDYFTLACVMATGLDWAYFAGDWKKALKAKNVELKRARRPIISRCHAADCSSRLGEFKGWSVAEQVAFTKRLIQAIAKRKMMTFAFTMPMGSFQAHFPLAQRDSQGYCYQLLLKQCMLEIANQVEKREAASRRSIAIAMVHDHCRYDAALQQAFWKLKNGLTFPQGNLFRSIASMTWQDCVPLQAADMLAFENWKEAARGDSERPRRKSLSALLDLKTFGGVARKFNEEGIITLRHAEESAASGPAGPGVC